MGQCKKISQEGHRRLKYNVTGCNIAVKHQFAQTGALVKVSALAGTDKLPSGRSIFNVTRRRCQICWCFLCPGSCMGEYVPTTPLTLLLTVSSQRVLTRTGLLLQQPLSMPFDHTVMLNSTWQHCFSLHTEAACLDDEVIFYALELWDWIFLSPSLLRVCVSGETKPVLTFPQARALMLIHAYATRVKSLQDMR